MRPVLVLVAVLLAGGALIVACGGGDDVRYRNGVIIKALDLAESEGGYAIGGDPFCEVETKLLNDPAEVKAARDGKAGGLVVTDQAGEVGVQGIAPFLPDCRRQAQRGLRRLARG